MTLCIRSSCDSLMKQEWFENWESIVHSLIKEAFIKPYTWAVQILSLFHSTSLLCRWNLTKRLPDLLRKTLLLHLDIRTGVILKVFQKRKELMVSSGFQKSQLQHVLAYKVTAARRESLSTIWAGGLASDSVSVFICLKCVSACVCVSSVQSM